MNPKLITSLTNPQTLQALKDKVLIYVKYEADEGNTHLRKPGQTPLVFHCCCL